MAYTFISGATGGIGGAFAEKCAAQGCDLFLTGRSDVKLNALKDKIVKEFGVNVKYFACDLADERSRAKMLEYIDGENVKFDRILNVAGVDVQKAFTDYTYEKLLFQVRVNAEATLSLTHALIGKMEGKGEILTVSSMSGVSPMPYFAVYSATKAMLTNFFTALHYELKEKGIKVTVVLPGGVYTRPDVVEAIKLQGLWGKISAKTPEYVAIKSLKALKKNKVKYVPGVFNKVLYFIMKITPAPIVLHFIARRWKKQTKDAF